MNLIIALAVIVIGLTVGEFLYRTRADAARLWGSFTVALYGSIMLLIGTMIVFGGGQWAFIGFLMVIFYFSVARTKWHDVSETDVRAAILGK